MQGVFYKPLGKRLCLLTKKKYVFAINHVIFLRFVVSSKGVHMDQEKVVAIYEWATPTYVSEVQSFHGLNNSSKRFSRIFA